MIIDREKGFFVHESIKRVKPLIREVRVGNNAKLIDHLMSAASICSINTKSSFFCLKTPQFQL